jgi:apolipoprotein D and lipocalin family protein
MQLRNRFRFLTGSRLNLAGAMTAMLALGCAGTNIPLEVVEQVDINRYAGKWYEIARYPNSFETGCVGVTADYSLREDGRINVVNTCIEGSLDGDSRLIEGVARPVDDTNSKLKVSFFFPFEGDYWIIDLDEDYQYAVVGEPARNFLWILSRTPQLDQEIVDGILASLPERAYDPDRLIFVEQEIAE